MRRHQQFIAPDVDVPAIVWQDKIGWVVTNLVVTFKCMIGSLDILKGYYACQHCGCIYEGFQCCKCGQ